MQIQLLVPRPPLTYFLPLPNDPRDTHVHTRTHMQTESDGKNNHRAKFKGDFVLKRYANNTGKKIKHCDRQLPAIS